MSIHTAPDQSKEDTQEFMTVKIDDQLFGIAVYYVQDVLASQKITSIPLAPEQVIGSINLRGRIVMMVDLRTCLKLSSLPDRECRKSIVVERKGDLYSLLVDAVGDVLTLPLAELTDDPNNMPPAWHQISDGVFMLEGQILIILDIEKLFEVMLQPLAVGDPRQLKL